jgi:antitoxin HicB
VTFRGRLGGFFPTSQDSSDGIYNATTVLSPRRVSASHFNKVTIVYSYKYPAVFTPEEGGFVVTFPDVPEAITEGDSVEKAVGNATDALDEAITGRINRRSVVPKASTGKSGQYLISVPLRMALKAGLYEEITKDGASQTDIAARLGIDEKEVRRLLDAHHPTKLPRIEEILRRVGVRTTITIKSQLGRVQSRRPRRE